MFGGYAGLLKHDGVATFRSTEMDIILPREIL